MRAVLVLEDGSVFEGKSFGAAGERVGEIVFNTSMTGYQEILTDPSYCGQMVIMTYPLIGNYGINDEDSESAKPWAEALIVKEHSPIASNFRQTSSLSEYLKKHKIPAIEGIDTRALTRKVRIQGAMRAIISTHNTEIESLLKKVKAAPEMTGRDLASEVTCQKTYVWPGSEENKLHVVAYDFGIKYNILRNLALAGCKITIIPAQTPAEEVLAMDPDGVFLSNGPGDPAAVGYAISNIQKLLGKKPIFGICLGHQLLGLALGAKTFKLKFGHHGGNQPVMNLKNKAVEITAQNHGFSIDPETLPKDEVKVTHINLNDKTVEGLRHKKLPIFSVQYHPEAGPGPHDANYLFKEFVEMMHA